MKTSTLLAAVTLLTIFTLVSGITAIYLGFTILAYVILAAYSISLMGTLAVWLTLRWDD